jgi:hypothetical protein
MERVNMFLNMNDEENLIGQLKIYDALYYTDGTSPIGDIEYDELKEHAKNFSLKIHTSKKLVRRLLVKK